MVEPGGGRMMLALLRDSDTDALYSAVIIPKYQMGELLQDSKIIRQGPLRSSYFWNAYIFFFWVIARELPAE